MNLADAGWLSACRPETLKPIAAWLEKQNFQTLMIVTDWQIDLTGKSLNWSAVTFRRDQLRIRR